MKNHQLWIPIIVYFLMSSGIILWKAPAHLFSVERLTNIFIFVGIFLLQKGLKPFFSHKNFQLFSVISIYAALSVLYKETAILNLFFRPEIDPWLVHLDHLLFGFQPAKVFSETFPMAWFSELMFFGYFWYYLMPLWVLYWIYHKAPEKIESFGWVLISSFLLYYLVFIIVPAVGPQFYYPYPQNEISSQGIFGNIIKLIQHNGEAPTAAFPSSHVGISWIVLIWVWKNLKNQWLFLLPFILLLMTATVYIKAHYAADVWAGCLSAIGVYAIINFSFKKLQDVYHH